MSRTIVDLVPLSDPWPVIDSWASANGFSVDGYGNWGRSYKRGDGFWTPISRVQIEATPTGLRLSAWVPFWGSGNELDIHNLNPLQYFPRKKAQDKVNALLRQLGAPTL
jgi:hypothetical protein